MKKLTMFLVVLMVMNLFVCVGFAQDMQQGYLEEASSWARAEITKASSAKIADRSLLSNYSQAITRREFCELAVMAYRTLGKSLPENAEEPFTETNDWYIANAYTLGIVKGVSETKFAPFDAITREQMATMMGRLASLVGVTMPEGNLSVFEDANQISHWAEEDIKAMVGAEILRGVSENQLAPGQQVSREQGIVLIWRLYRFLGGEDVLLYEETTPDFLIQSNIITKEDWNKSEYITILEVLETLAKTRECFSDDKADLSRWYYGDTLASMDYLDDSTKELLLGLCMNSKNQILVYAEIPNLKLDENITNYEGLLYITRMVADTYYCTDVNLEYESKDAASIYESAYKKGLINTTDISDAKEPMKREAFYQLLHKALFVEYSSGGYTTVYTRLIDTWQWRMKNQVAEKEKEVSQEKEQVEIFVQARIEEDLSVTWELPEAHTFLRDYGMVRLELIYKDGTTNLGWSSSSFKAGVEASHVLRMLIEDVQQEPERLRCTYTKYGIETEYYFDVDFSKIHIVEEGEEVHPGAYTRNHKAWTANRISLAEGESFEKGCFYLLIGYQKDYRKEEYNKITYECFRAEEDSDVFIAPTNRSFGVNEYDDVRIRKITVSKNKEGGLVLFVTPESQSFVVEELPQ